MEIRRTVTIRATSDEDESITFTVPIEIIVRLHSESGPMVARAAGPETGVAEDAAIAAAIALTRRNRDLTPQEYYDKQADALDMPTIAAWIQVRSLRSCIRC